jgi:hypothetical protein
LANDNPAEHFHMWSGRMYLNRRRLFRRGFRELGWSESKWPDAARLLIACDFEIRGARDERGATYVVPENQLESNEIFSARIQYASERRDTRYLRAYRCDLPDCPERNQGGFIPKFIDGGDVGPDYYR